jgi:3'(2'), 5'-bisphosphate nucleotidase
MGYERELDAARKIGQEAAAVVMAIYERAGRQQDLDVAHKANDAGPVTEADMAANDLIVARLAELFPEDAILAEESSDDPTRFEKPRFWCVDPMDGTKEFIKRNGEFSVMIGLVDRELGKPVVGVVVEPVADKITYAALGHGTWVETASSREEGKVSKVDSAEELRLIVSRSHPDKETKTVVESLGIPDMRRCGSVGLKIGRIVEDAADVYVNFSGRTHYWDTAAPQVILEEAGGRLTTIHGAPLNYLREGTLNVEPYVASNGVSHETVCKACVDARDADA